MSSIGSPDEDAFDLYTESYQEKNYDDATNMMMVIAIMMTIVMMMTMADHLSRISSKGCDIVLDPLQSSMLVPQT